MQIATMLICMHPLTSRAAEEKVNPVTGYELTILPPTKQQTKPFGWIRLVNGGASAGYIYLETESIVSDPALNSNKTYIITHMPYGELGTLLAVLREERNLQIGYFDPQAPGVGPSVFLESANGLNTNASDFTVESKVFDMLRSRPR